MLNWDIDPKKSSLLVFFKYLFILKGTYYSKFTFALFFNIIMCRQCVYTTTLLWSIHFVSYFPHKLETDSKCKWCSLQNQMTSSFPSLEWSLTQSSFTSLDLIGRVMFSDRVMGRAKVWLDHLAPPIMSSKGSQMSSSTPWLCSEQPLSK